MKTASDYIWYLKFKITNMEKELDAYRSGNQIKKLRHDYEAVIREKDREIWKWKKEAARAHAEAVTVRKYWSEIFDDLEREKKREIQKAVAETKRMEQRALAAEKKNEGLEEKIKEERREKYALGEELEKPWAKIRNSPHRQTWISPILLSRHPCRERGEKRS